MISLAFWMQYTSVTDRQTDRQTPADSKYRAYT